MNVHVDAAPPTVAGADRRLDRAFELLRDSPVRVLSLDVFDTLLARQVPEPADAFTMLGARLAAAGTLCPSIAPRVFVAARVEAERRARARVGGDVPEVGLVAICEELRNLVDMSAADLAALEIQLERDITVV